MRRSLNLLLIFLLICLVFSSTSVIADSTEENAEIRLWVHAVFTGKHQTNTKSRGAGPLASKTKHDMTDQLSLVFSGTSTWRIQDWMPVELFHNHSATALGSGNIMENEEGITSTQQHNNIPFSRTLGATWGYEVPSSITTFDAMAPMMSPAGSVSFNPYGTWVLNLMADPNIYKVTPKGMWFQRYINMDVNNYEEHPINSSNSAPNGPLAKYLMVDAWQNTLGAQGNGLNIISGKWDPKEKGYFTSGHIVKRGGQGTFPVGEMPSGDPTSGYYFGTQSEDWSADIIWTLSFNRIPPPVECIIEADDGYDQWLPQAGKDEQTVGSLLGVSAKLQVKNDPEATPTQRAQFRFELHGVSKEPGISLNFPSNSAATGPDLKFQPSSSMELKDSDRVAESVATNLLEARAIVGAYDYGAFGQIRIVATLQDGGTVYCHLKGKNGQEELSIPLDENKNKIADSWEISEGIFGKNLPASDDQEKEPVLDGVPGDGISLYEEYRGLLHQGGIIRMSATIKDLVVENQMEDQARRGLKIFENASKVKIVELSSNELAEGRIINLNASTGHNGSQYGLRLLSGPLPEGIIGISLPDRMKTSPRESEQTIINNNLSFLPAEDFELLLAVGIAHEIGHSLGAQHHGDSPSGTTYENVTVNDLNTKVIKTDGTPVTRRPYDIIGLIESKKNGGESSGEQNCIMRNSSYFQWVKRLDNLGMFTYYAVPPTPPGQSLCSSQSGSGINASDNRPISYFGNAASGRGACITNIRIKDY